jgi:hypothetical protein
MTPQPDQYDGMSKGKPLPPQEALEYISNYIYKQLNSPVARRTRKLMALSAKNGGVIIVSWEGEGVPRSDQPHSKH